VFEEFNEEIFNALVEIEILTPAYFFQLHNAQGWRVK